MWNAIDSFNTLCLDGMIVRYYCRSIPYYLYESRSDVVGHLFFIQTNETQQSTFDSYKKPSLCFLAVEIMSVDIIACTSLDDARLLSGGYFEHRNGGAL